MQSSPSLALLARLQDLEFCSQAKTIQNPQLQLPIIVLHAFQTCERKCAEPACLTKTVRAELNLAFRVQASETAEIARKRFYSAGKPLHQVSLVSLACKPQTLVAPLNPSVPDPRPDSVSLSSQIGEGTPGLTAPSLTLRSTAEHKVVSRASGAGGLDTD